MSSYSLPLCRSLFWSVGGSRCGMSLSRGKSATSKHMSPRQHEKGECLKKSKCTWRQHSNSGCQLNMRNSGMNSWPRRKSSSANGNGSGLSSWNGKWSSRMNGWPTTKKFEASLLEDEAQYWGATTQRRLFQRDLIDEEYRRSSDEHTGGSGHHPGWGPVSHGTTAVCQSTSHVGHKYSCVHASPSATNEGNCHVEIMRENVKMATMSNRWSNTEAQKSITRTARAHQAK